MISEMSFKDVKIGTMFLWASVYCVKVNKDFGEYSPGKEFFFHAPEIVKIDDKCIEYNEGLKHEAN